MTLMEFSTKYNQSYEFAGLGENGSKYFYSGITCVLDDLMIKPPNGNKQQKL